MKNNKPFLLSLLGTTIAFCLIISVVYLLKINLRFSPYGVILYFFCSTVLIISLLKILFVYANPQAAYGFLFTVFIKVGFFVLIFQKSVFGLDYLTGLEKMVLILPFFTFLIIEVLYAKAELKYV
jgi:hypothetical protein